MARHLHPYDADFQRVYYEDPNTVNVVFPDGGFVIFDNLPTATHNAPGRHRYDEAPLTTTAVVIYARTISCPREWDDGGCAISFEHL